MNEEQPHAQRAHELLRAGYGPGARFRDGQLEAILAVVADRARALVVQRTGWGKSAVYFVATRLLREAGAGPTVVVSPLLALMRDQLGAAHRLGLRAVTINSSNKGEWDAAEAAIEDRSADLVLVSPERFNNPDFRDRVLPTLLARVGLLVIDEAHCISDWGHDFRPDYRRLSSLIGLLPPGVPVLATTATANTRVEQDIAEQFGDLQVFRGPLGRDSLVLHAVDLPTRAERFAWIDANLDRLPGTGLVYCLTVDDAETLAGWLSRCGHETVAYSGRLDAPERAEIERRLQDNDVKVVCTTSALGMGVDKPDLGFVIHFQSPDSPVAYYQQIGRAGRALDRGEVFLLAGSEDAAIWQYFLESSLPLQAHAEAVVDLLQHDLIAGGTGRSVTDMETELNLSQGRITALLKVLEVDGAVVREGSTYRRTLAPWHFDHERLDRVRAHRLHEQAAMRAYPGIDTCRMAYLLAQLDDAAAAPCGRCDNCRGVTVERPDPAAVAAASQFLRGRPKELEPRKRWPDRRTIAAERRTEPGRALARLNDGGWGQVVLDCKQSGRMFPEELVEALAELIRAWAPQPELTILTFVPTLDQSRDFVPDLAERVGKRLHLPVVPLLVKRRATKPQKLMENSAHRLANLTGAFEVDTALVEPGRPVLLLDDVVDSRWTMTYLGSLLREAGCGEVHPIALARSRE